MYVESLSMSRSNGTNDGTNQSVTVIGSDIVSQEPSWTGHFISRLKRLWLKEGNTLPPASLEFDDLEQPNTAYEEPWSETLHAWRLEILACLASLASFIALTTMAAAFSERPLADWSLQFISINGVVAGLTVVMKGSLVALITESICQAKWAWFSNQSTTCGGRSLGDLEIIDEVSRGPWGSAIWLCKHPLEINLITISATIMLLASVVDVFSQQLVTTNLRSIVDKSQKAHVAWVGSTNAPVDEQDWKTAFEEGMYSYTIDDLPTTCPSGNCTWPTVLTIGMCGECVDVTHHLPSSWITCANSFCNFSLVATKDLTAAVRFDRWGYTLHNGPQPNSTWTENMFETNVVVDVLVETIANVPWSSVLPTGPSIDAYPEFDGDQQWTRFSRMVFSDFAIIDMSPKLDTQSPLPSFGSPVVTTCSFWVCIQAMTIKEISGDADQTIISAPNPSYSDINLPGPSYFSPYSKRSGTFSKLPAFNMEGWNFTVNTTNFYQYAAASNEARIVTVEVTPVWFPFSINHPALLDRFNYVKNDSQGWADRIAKSLTNRLRLANQCKPEDDIYAGEVWIQQIYIQVSWPWVALPAAVLVSTLALFAGTLVRMLRSRNQPAWHTPKWGNGALALLLCDVSDVIKRRARGSYRSTEALLDVAGDIPVCLEGGEEGWTFRTVP
ncbi:hypothetical protein HD806DRAFT_541720 [Xylariaceae sp. AK1471]|nr:hypothetical protein HD806DRAFT_541720 [Xylariaceae sp. AK1471]